MWILIWDWSKNENLQNFNWKIEWSKSSIIITKVITSKFLFRPSMEDNETITKIALEHFGITVDKTEPLKQLCNYVNKQFLQWFDV